MPNSTMRDSESITETLAGSLLVASPGLGDANFHKAVILLSVHSHEEGALGVVINHPTGKLLSEFDEHFAETPLKNVPVYQGGPVAGQQMILSAWKACEDTGVFRLYFGISEEKAAEILEQSPQAILRAFIGYAGWTSGQLESEISQDAWVISPVNTQALASADGEALWKTILNDLNPELAKLPRPPEDPSVN